MLVAVLALVPRWFPAARVPLVTQLTAILSQTGQILSAVPFVALLSAVGWSFAFGVTAAASALAALLALTIVRTPPAGRGRRQPRCRCARPADPSGTCGGVRARGWASSGTWAPSSP